MNEKKGKEQRAKRKKCENACPTASFRLACPKELVQAGMNAIMHE